MYKAVCRGLAPVRARFKRASSALFCAKGGRLPTVGEIKNCEELATQAMVAANRWADITAIPRALKLLTFSGKVIELGLRGVASVTNTPPPMRAPKPPLTTKTWQ